MSTERIPTQDEWDREFERKQRLAASQNPLETIGIKSDDDEPVCGEFFGIQRYQTKILHGKNTLKIQAGIDTSKPGEVVVWRALVNSNDFSLGVDLTSKGQFRQLCAALGIDPTVPERPPAPKVCPACDNLLDEKKRRIYYQDIVYAVCNEIDRVYGKKIACGTADSPTTNVQTRMGHLVQMLSDQTKTIAILRDRANGNYWAWQADGSDNLETLTCPVLISPADLKKLIQADSGASHKPAPPPT